MPRRYGEHEMDEYLADREQRRKANEKEEKGPGFLSRLFGSGDEKKKEKPESDDESSSSSDSSDDERFDISGWDGASDP